MTSHQLAKRLLELPDRTVITSEGQFVSEVFVDTYDTATQLNLPSICLEVVDE